MAARVTAAMHRGTRSPVLFDVPASLRRGTRVLGRAVAGIEGLGVGPVVLSLLQRGERNEAGSGSCWVVATTDTTTRVWVHNYWSDAYDVARPELTATLLDADGTVRATWKLRLDPDATEVVDVRARCEDAGVALPFDGSLLLEHVDAAVAPGRPIQVFTEYLRDDGEASGVHGQFGLMHAPYGQRIATMRVEHDEHHRTAVVVTNPYRGPGSLRPLRAGIEVSNADGATRRGSPVTVPPNGTQVVFLDDVVEDLDELLDGRTGHVRMQVPCPVSRVATFVEDRRTGRRVVNHGTIDRTFQQDGGLPNTWRGAGPVASVPVLAGDWYTELTLPNVWGPDAGPYAAEVCVFGPGGEWLLTHHVDVDTRALRTVDFDDVFAAHGVDRPRVAHAEVRLLPGGGQARPATFDVLVGIRRAGDLVGDVQVGAEYFNADVPPGVRFPDVRRTRVFGRARVGASVRSLVVLGHPCADPDRAEATEPHLTLLDASGRTVASGAVTIPAHGCVLFDVADWFGITPDALGSDGRGMVRVRDTAARLYGYHFVETQGARNVVADHLLGG